MRNGVTLKAMKTPPPVPAVLFLPPALAAAPQPERTPIGLPIARRRDTSLDDLAEAIALSARLKKAAQTDD